MISRRSVLKLATLFFLPWGRKKEAYEWNKTHELAYLIARSRISPARLQDKLMPVQRFESPGLVYYLRTVGKEA